MKQKISAGLAVIICGLIMVALLLTDYRVAEENIMTGEPAENYEQLELYVQYSSNVEQINIWKSEADCYYFFLPSCVVKSRISFGNITQKDSVLLEQTEYTIQDDISKDIEYNVIYEMQLILDGKALPPQKVVFQCSENIPAVFIDTQDGTVERLHAEKGIKETAEVTIVNEKGDREFVGAVEYIKTRGNSTFYEVEKKSYQIKLQKKKDLFGLGEAKKWILLANAKDESLIRNAMIFDFAAEYTDLPSIEGVFVDVYLNGDYAGNYYLCEKVEVNSERLNITDLEQMNEKVNDKEQLEQGECYVSEDGTIRAMKGLKNPEDITGGYLLERIIEEEYFQAPCAFTSSKGYWYSVVSPENATVEQVEYIRNLVNELETAVSQPDGMNPETGKHYSEYMDVESWVSKFLIEEVFSNPDAPYASTYMYKDTDEVDGKIHFGPVWDYDRAIGGYVVNNFDLDDPKQMSSRGLYASWLLQFEEIEEAVKAEYEEVFLPYVEKKAEGRIKELQDSIEASAQMDKVRWPNAKGYYGEWDSYGTYMANFLEERIEYLNDIWLQNEVYHTIVFLDYDGNICHKYVVKHGEYLPEIPSVANYVAIFQGWQNIVTGRKLDIRLPILEDTTYQSKWIPAEYLILNGLAVANAELEEIDIEALEALLQTAKEMKEAAMAQETETEAADE